MSTNKKPCIRCGVIREQRNGSQRLCRDCVVALSPNERKMWLTPTNPPKTTETFGQSA